MRKRLITVVIAVAAATLTTSPALAANTYEYDTGTCETSFASAGVMYNSTYNIAVGDSVSFTVVTSGAECALWWQLTAPATDYVATVTANGVDVPVGFSLPLAQAPVGSKVIVTITAGSVDVEGAGVVLYLGPVINVESVTAQQGYPYGYAALVRLSSTPDALPETGSNPLVRNLSLLVLLAGAGLTLVARRARV